MTNNKLPEVGKKYKAKEQYSGNCIVTIKKIDDNKVYIEENKEVSFFSLNFFQRAFEELPDQPTSAKSAQVGSEKLEEAKNELKEILEASDLLFEDKNIWVVRLAQRLVNVLEESEEKWDTMEAAQPKEQKAETKLKNK